MDPQQRTLTLFPNSGSNQNKDKPTLQQQFIAQFQHHSNPSGGLQNTYLQRLGYSQNPHLLPAKTQQNDQVLVGPSKNLRDVAPSSFNNRGKHLAMSANTNIGRKETNEISGLHNSTDPDPKHLSYSNTFMNYKQHVKEQSSTIISNINNSKQRFFTENQLPPNGQQARKPHISNYAIDETGRENQPGAQGAIVPAAQRSQSHRIDGKPRLNEKARPP